MTQIASLVKLIGELQIFMHEYVLDIPLEFTKAVWQPCCHRHNPAACKCLSVMDGE